ncbi:NADH-quinone oxidoreductase subunit B family protein [Quatrionicoccus australiensis]|uniref:NADH-quinone oxidoreductase subunit B family protein n=1 Tax=Quatrionicoccus australiensis TaxID=138118 RepID=UPI001CF9032A|nr:HupU protein [Quatrionicoccus australiensis]UCV14939.1 HupU protein [Quatrionicoccus australiensis]
MKVLWLQSGGCGGCTQSLLCSEPRSLFDELRDAGIEFVWHPALSQASGGEALAVLEACASGELAFDVLCVEGAMLRGPNGSGRFHLMAGNGRPLTEWVTRLAGQAKWVFAIGSCTAYGGFSANTPGNPLEACGLQYDEQTPGGLLGAGFRSAGGLPVVNIAGCPTHPGWIVESLQKLALEGMADSDLDELGRPLFYAGELVHHGCPRNEYYEFKASAEKQSDLGCLMENLGCKGTQAHADCNLRAWNGSGSCLRGGFACIACTEPGFESPGHAFQETPKVAGIPIGLPSDMPKAWFVALAALSKSATPKRVRDNAVVDHLVFRPAIKKKGGGK